MADRVGKILGSTRKLVCTPFNLLVNRIDPPVLVLLYHRVTTLASDPELLAVTPANFRAQMRYIKENFPLVRFEDEWSDMAKPAVCVTFDDGYADNALEALPILEEVGVPATFFVSTGNVGTDREFWWHEVERLILGQRVLPPMFSLEVPARSWKTGSEAERRILYDGLVRLMKDALPRQRGEWLDRLRCWAEVEPAPNDRHSSMTPEELRLLGGSSMVTIGAHTVSHSRLASLSVSEQEEEVVASKRQLETWLGREITVFSYPFGRRCDYAKETIALCREAGFTKVAANFPGQAHRWTDPYQIPRHLVRNWPLELFAEKLRGFWTR
jgi:peptidoglycan/xylan/chitin deacetylase (PgdA/CDA1 family)